MDGNGIFNGQNSNKIVIKIKNSGRLLATSDVPISTIDFGVIIIREFKIWKSDRFNSRLQDSIQITPPSQSIPGTKKSHYFVYIEKSHIEDWFKLEKLIYDAYIESKNEEVRAAPPATTKPEEEVNPDDIPF